MSMLLPILAEQMETVSKQDLKEGYGGLIFIGIFVLALLGLAIWWLKRSA